LQKIQPPFTKSRDSAHLVYGIFSALAPSTPSATLLFGRKIRITLNPLDSAFT
jgi:hypothetical protein